ncbi:hypothetical protein ACFWWA_25115 [Streptomyces goshikiensis]|uniref:hypothetical protein n=1 Tax=Streptomyces goshikiensis TaxID=1942 RepID=UPI0036495B71
MFTLISCVLAVVGHHLASEEPVPWPRAAAGAVVVFALSWCAARPCRTGRHVLMATGLAQLLLHHALSVPRAAHGSAVAVGHTAHHSTWTMTAAHCAAACVMALLMHRADRALSRLPETVGRWVQAAVQATVTAAVTAFGACRRPGVRPVPGSGRVVLDGLAVRPIATTMLCHAVVRRGPPAGRAGDVSLILTGTSAAG